MKTKSILSLMSAFMLVLSFSSCTDDDSDSSPSSSNNNQSNQEQFTYNADGVSKVSTDSIFVMRINNSVSITAEESGAFPKGSISIFFPDTLSLGTYTLGGSSVVSMLYSKKTDASSSIPYSTLNGVFTLSQNQATEGRFEGTFNFTAFYQSTVDTVEINNGKFRVIE